MKSPASRPEISWSAVASSRPGNTGGAEYCAMTLAMGKTATKTFVKNHAETMIATVQKATHLLEGMPSVWEDVGQSLPL